MVPSVGSLSPSFDSATTTYYLSLSNTQTTIRFTPTTTNVFATIKVINEAVTSGFESSDISLSVGNTTIAITVTAQDDTTITTYTVVVNRAPCKFWFLLLNFR